LSPSERRERSDRGSGRGGGYWEYKLAQRMSKGSWFSPSWKASVHGKGRGEVCLIKENRGWGRGRNRTGKEGRDYRGRNVVKGKGLGAYIRGNLYT